MSFNWFSVIASCYDRKKGWVRKIGVIAHVCPYTVTNYAATQLRTRIW